MKKKGFKLYFIDKEVRITKGMVDGKEVRKRERVQNEVLFSEFTSHTNYTNTMNEHLVEEQNDRKVLTFDIPEKVESNGGLPSEFGFGKFLKIGRGMKLELLDDQGVYDTSYFIISSISPVGSGRNLVWSIVAEDAFSFIYARTNTELIIDTIEDEEFHLWLREDREAWENSIITGDGAPEPLSPWGFRGKNIGGYETSYIFRTGVARDIVEYIMEEGHLKKRYSPGSDKGPFEWEIISSRESPIHEKVNLVLDGTNTYNAIVEMTLLIDSYLEVDYNNLTLDFISKDDDSFRKNLVLSPEFNLQDLSLDYNSDSFYPILFVHGGEDEFGLSVGMIPYLRNINYKRIEDSTIFKEDLIPADYSPLENGGLYSRIFEEEDAFLPSSETLQILDSVPYLDTFILDLNYFLKNGILKEEEAEDIEHRIYNDLRRINLRLQTVLYEKLTIEGNISKIEGEIDFHASELAADTTEDYSKKNIKFKNFFLEEGGGSLTQRDLYPSEATQLDEAPIWSQDQETIRKLYSNGHALFPIDEDTYLMMVSYSTQMGWEEIDLSQPGTILGEKEFARVRIEGNNGSPEYQHFATGTFRTRPNYEVKFTSSIKGLSSDQVHVFDQDLVIKHSDKTDGWDPVHSENENPRDYEILLNIEDKTELEFLDSDPKTTEVLKIRYWDHDRVWEEADTAPGLKEFPTFIEELPPTAVGPERLMLIEKHGRSDALAFPYYKDLNPLFGDNTKKTMDDLREMSQAVPGFEYYRWNGVSEENKSLMYSEPLRWEGVNDIIEFVIPGELPDLKYSGGPTIITDFEIERAEIRFFRRAQFWDSSEVIRSRVELTKTNREPGSHGGYGLSSFILEPEDRKNVIESLQEYYFSIVYVMRDQVWSGVNQSNSVALGEQNWVYSDRMIEPFMAVEFSSEPRHEYKQDKVYLLPEINKQAFYVSGTIKWQDGSVGTYHPSTALKARCVYDRLRGVSHLEKRTWAQVTAPKEYTDFGDFQLISAEIVVETASIGNQYSRYAYFDLLALYKGTELIEEKFEELKRQIVDSIEEREKLQVEFDRRLDEQREMRSDASSGSMTPEELKERMKMVDLHVGTAKQELEVQKALVGDWRLAGSELIKGEVTGKLVIYYEFFKKYKEIYNNEPRGVSERGDRIYDFKEYGIWHEYREASTQKDKFWFDLREDYGECLYEGFYENALETEPWNLFLQAKSIAQYHNSPSEEYGLTYLDGSSLLDRCIDLVRVGDFIKIREERLGIMREASNEIQVSSVARDLRDSSNISLSVDQVRRSDRIIEQLIKDLR